MAANIHDLLQCSICLGQLKEPRILPCFHSFCEKCLDTHIQTSTRRTQGYFFCPSCRIITKTPGNHTQKFPLDFRLIQFLDVLKSVTGQNKSLCDVCNSEEKYENAETFCYECRKRFCSSCTSSHRSKSFLSSHMIVNINSEDHIMNRSTVRCSNHREEDITFTCQTCNLDLCVVCVIKDHQEHDIVHCQPDSLINNQIQLTDVFKSLHKRIWKIHEDIFNLTCLEGRLKSKYAQSKYQIQKQARKMMQRILGDEKKFMRELDEAFIEKRSEIDQLKSIFQTNLTQMEICQSQLNALLTSAELSMSDQNRILHDINSLETTSVPRTSTTLQSFKQFVPGGLFQIGKFEDISLNMDTDHLSELTAPNSAARNHMHTSASLNDLSSVTDRKISLRKNGSCDALRFVDKSDDSNVRNNNQYVINVHPISAFGNQNDASRQLCLPYNICFSENDEIIVAENGNKRLQIYDKYGYCVKTIGQGTIIPRSVAMIKGKEIAITDELTKSVKVYDLQGELLRDFMPRCMTLPYGITSASNGDFLFTDMIYETVSVVKQDGELRYQFGGHGYTDNHFDNPGYLLVDSRNRILVSDSSNHCIKVFTKHGHYLFKFGSYGTGAGKLRYPKAISSDKSGNIFVVDSGNDRVVMFSKDGSYLGVVLDKSHGLLRPTGMCLSKTNLIAISMPDIGEIRVFAIST